MIDFETYHKIHQLHKELLTAEQIAIKLGNDVKTVRKWLECKRFTPRAKPASRPVSKLDPHKEMIVAWLEQHDYSGAQILHRLRSEYNYEGGKSLLNYYIAKVRPVRRTAYLSLAFSPGDCMQVDWGTHGVLNIGGAMRKLHYFAAVLCHSRALYVEFYLSQSMECFLCGHRRALEFFGASTRRVMHDNLKTAVIERLPGHAPKFNPKYLDFAGHYGFQPVACNIAKGNEKGRVENAIGYVQKSFLNGLEISSLGALNISVRRWLDEVANVRLHRETQRRPCDLLLEEKPHMQPLPLWGYDISQSRRVRATNRCQVAFEANRYSVPFAHAGAFLELRAHPDTIVIYRNDKVVAEHPRNYGRDQIIDNPDHTSGLLKERKRGEESALLAHFLALSAKAEAYFQAMRQRDLNAVGQVRRILLLVGIHGRELVAAALEEASELGAYGSEYLRNILQYRQENAPLFGQLHLLRSAELLDLELPPADCSRFEIPTEPTTHNLPENTTQTQPL